MKNIKNNSYILITFILSLLLSISLCDIIIDINSTCRNKISEDEYQGLFSLFTSTNGSNWVWIGEPYGMYLSLYIHIIYLY